MSGDRDENEVTLTTADLKAVRAIIREELAALKGGTHAAPQTTDAGRGAGGGGRAFKFGRQKGEPLSAGTVDNLQWYGERIAESIDNPEKQRWRGDNEATLSEINRHLRAKGGIPIAAPGEDAPAWGGGGQSSPHDAPPPDFGTGGGDDIPF